MFVRVTLSVETKSSVFVSARRDLKQIAIHLQDLARNGPEAARARSALYALLRELAELKAERNRRDALLEDA